VDTPLTGVDTVFQTLRQNEEEKVKCVDTASSGVDTSPRFQRTQLTGLHGSVDTGSSTVDTRSSSQKTCLAVLDKQAMTILEKRRLERERLCIQRSSRAAPLREEEGEEEKELEIARVLI
ncbi:hypothetical protein Taro_000939, partial [Colocasia esculenta]|nr:hypothetical protein [Colocasia esculenta]